jgi:hypothetical protein
VTLSAKVHSSCRTQIGPNWIDAGLSEESVLGHPVVRGARQAARLNVGVGSCLQRRIHCAGQADAQAGLDAFTPPDTRVMRFSYEPPDGGGPAVPILYLHWASLSFLAD